MHEWEGLTYKARGRGSNTVQERFHAWEACVGPVWDPSGTHVNTGCVSHLSPIHTIGQNLFERDRQQELKVAYVVAHETHLAASQLRVPVHKPVQIFQCVRECHGGQVGGRAIAAVAIEMPHELLLSLPRAQNV